MPILGPRTQTVGLVLLQGLLSGSGAAGRSSLALPCPPPLPLPSRLCTRGFRCGDLRSCAPAEAELDRRRDSDHLELRSLERERPSPCRSRSHDRERFCDLERRRRLARLGDRDRQCLRSLDRLIPRRSQRTSPAESSGWTECRSVACRGCPILRRHPWGRACRHPWSCHPTSSYRPKTG